jgi:hypothetical protein
MPEMPVRVWWSDPNPALKPTILALIFLTAVGILWTEKWAESPLWVDAALFAICLAVLVLVEWKAGAPPHRLVCLTTGVLVVIDHKGAVTRIPLATASLRTTKNGCQIEWEGEKGPTKFFLPRFTEPHRLASAIETPRAEESPVTAAKLPVAPVLTLSRWIGSQYWFVAMTGISLAATMTDRDWLYAFMPLFFWPWLDLFRWNQPWVIITPAGLWLLRHDKDPRLIPAGAITGARPYLWADCIVKTTDPNYPTLKLGFLPDDLRRILTPGGAFHA